MLAFLLLYSYKLYNRFIRVIWTSSKAGQSTKQRVVTKYEDLTENSIQLDVNLKSFSY